MTLYLRGQRFSVPSAPSAKLACPDGVHHYAKGKCLRCGESDAFATKPQHDLDAQKSQGRTVRYELTPEGRTALAESEELGRS